MDWGWVLFNYDIKDQTMCVQNGFLWTDAKGHCSEHHFETEYECASTPGTWKYHEGTVGITLNLDVKPSFTSDLETLRKAVVITMLKQGESENNQKLTTSLGVKASSGKTIEEILETPYLRQLESYIEFIDMYACEECKYKDQLWNIGLNCTENYSIIPKHSERCVEFVKRPIHSLSTSNGSCFDKNLDIVSCPNSRFCNWDCSAIEVKSDCFDKKYGWGCKECDETKCLATDTGFSIVNLQTNTKNAGDEVVTTTTDYILSVPCVDKNDGFKWYQSCSFNTYTMPTGCMPSR